MDRTLLAEFRNVLANLYPDEASIRRIIADAELTLGQIALHSTARNNWHAVLTEAVKVDQLELLLGVVADEYGKNKNFQAVLAAYQRSTGQRSNTNRASSLPLQAQLSLRNQHQVADFPPDHSTNQGPTLT